jgi:hypothetical protein
VGRSFATVCVDKGATLRFPTWRNHNVGVAPFLSRKELCHLAKILTNGSTAKTPEKTTTEQNVEAGEKRPRPRSRPRDLRRRTHRGRILIALTVYGSSHASRRE